MQPDKSLFWSEPVKKYKCQRLAVNEHLSTPPVFFYMDSALHDRLVHFMHIILKNVEMVVKYQ